MAESKTVVDKKANLQNRCHKDRAAHEGKDHQASEALFSDAEELGLLPGSWALWLQLQAVDVGDGEDGSCYEPGQAHQRAQTEHHTHHEQIQVVSAAFLKRETTLKLMLMILMHFQHTLFS